MKKTWLLVLICAAIALISVGCGNQRSGGADKKQRRVAAGTQTGTNIPRWTTASSGSRDTRAKGRAAKAKRDKREKKARAEKPKKQREERRQPAAAEEVITRGGFR